MPLQRVVGTLSSKLHSGDLIVLEVTLGELFAEQALPDLEQNRASFRAAHLRLCEKLGLEARGGVFELERYA